MKVSPFFRILPFVLGLLGTSIALGRDTTGFQELVNETHRSIDYILTEIDSMNAEMDSLAHSNIPLEDIARNPELTNVSLRAIANSIANTGTGVDFLRDDTFNPTIQSNLTKLRNYDNLTPEQLEEIALLEQRVQYGLKKGILEDLLSPIFYPLNQRAEPFNRIFWFERITKSTLEDVDHYLKSLSPQDISKPEHQQRIQGHINDLTDNFLNRFATDRFRYNHENFIPCDLPACERFDYYFAKYYYPERGGFAQYKQNLETAIERLQSLLGKDPVPPPTPSTGFQDQVDAFKNMRLLGGLSTVREVIEYNGTIPLDKVSGLNAGPFAAYGRLLQRAHNEGMNPNEFGLSSSPFVLGLPGSRPTTSHAGNRVKPLINKSDSGSDQRP